MRQEEKESAGEKIREQKQREGKRVGEVSETEMSAKA